VCGRFAFYSPSEATAALFGAGSSNAEFRPRYNIAPTTQLAAVRRDKSGEPELVALRWGLVPFWAKDPAIGNRMINARAETVAEKPSFRAAYRARRCLLLADGFYEWHKHGDEKTPWFISRSNDEPFAFAGLWEDWTDKETGESLQSTAIITTAANDFMAQLHHRMPVLVTPDLANAWLDGAQDALERVIEQTPKLKAWPVAKTVNNTRNQGAELVVPAGQELQN